MWYSQCSPHTPPQKGLFEKKKAISKGKTGAAGAEKAKREKNQEGATACVPQAALLFVPAAPGGHGVVQAFHYKYYALVKNYIPLLALIGLDRKSVFTDFLTFFGPF